MDGPPDDKEGFFGHPLTRAEIAINGEAQQDAQREAFLHEYMNLQAWDKHGGRIRDCFASPAVAPSSGGVSVSVSTGGAEDGVEGVVSSSSSSSTCVVVSDCSMSVGDVPGSGENKMTKGAQVPCTNANDYFILLDPQNNELGKFDHFDPILQGDPQVACPEVDVSFPAEAAVVELDVTSASASLGKIKSEENRGCRRPCPAAPSLQKPTTTTTRGGPVRRLIQPARGLPVRSLRRSESEPCTTLTERVFAVGGGRLSTLTESGFEDPFSAEALVAECVEVRAAAQTLVNGAHRDAQDSVVRVHGATQTPSTSGCDDMGGLDAALTVSAVSSSGLPPRGHCVISSSSQPTLRLSSAAAASNPPPESSSPVPAPAKASGARGKGRGGSKGGQARARGGQKEGTKSKSNKRRNSVPSAPTIITSTSTAPAFPSSASQPTVTCTSITMPSSSSPGVLSSTLLSEVSAAVAGIPEDVLASSISGPSSSVIPSSCSSGSPASVLLLPLANGGLLPVEQEAAAGVGMPLQGGQPDRAQTHSDTAAAETVKQTTKDKLKLRIAAQTAMTQMPEHHHHPHPHLMNGRVEMQQHPDLPPPPVSYTHPYQLHQQQHQQLQQHSQQQNHQQQQPPPSSSSPEQQQQQPQHLTYLSEEELAVMNLGGKFAADILPNIKQEDQFLDYDTHYPPPYATSEASSLQVLYNSVPMATGGVVTGEDHGGDLVSMAPVSGGREPQAVLSEAEIFSQMSSDSLLVQPQFLHLLQPVDMGQPPQQNHQHQQQQQQQSQQHLSNGYYNSNDNLYIYTSNSDNNGKMEENLLDMDSDKAVLQYAHQQQQQQQLQQQQQQQHPMHEHYGYGSNGYQQYVSVGSVDTSPDSGIGHDPGLSPNAAVMTLKESSGSDGVSRKEGKSLKRRKSSQNAVLQRQCSSGSDKVLPRNPAIQKLEVNTTGYQYHMDTPISTTQRIEEDRVTYLNKSQYYPLILENTRPERVPKGVMCKSVIMLVFREEKCQEEESKAWQFWHSRQHSYKQRILDIDTKNSQGVGPNSISELAFNAVSVKWNPREGPVRVNIAVHCLSTDFSNQKGVKGIPLHIQCDTYELFDSSKELLPSHRGYCQIKVFCDKGAERKTRDEERRRNAKVSKQPDPAASSGYSRRKRSEEVFHPPCERSDFYSMADLSTSPVYFSPSYVTGDSTIEEAQSAVKIEDSSSQQSPSQSGEVLEESTPAKMPRLTSCASCNKLLTPLLYVKESQDKAYHAIHLELPTVEELLKAISHKFNKKLQNVPNFFKRSKNGMLVRMDDDIIRRYSHETAFLLEIHNEGREDMEVILLETSH